MVRNIEIGTVVVFRGELGIVRASWRGGPPLVKTLSGPMSRATWEATPLFLVPKEDMNLPLAEILDKYQQEIAEVLLAILMGGQLLKLIIG